MKPMRYERTKLKPSLRNLAIFNDTTLQKLRRELSHDKELLPKLKANFLKSMKNKKKKEEYLNKINNLG